ncbi:hypothetical protein [Methylocystis echinoides]|uniref:Membrane protein n=1 Tax=Methylocystis echinoides TaxID=29468 RepID=A0A9W6GUS5_9HYPH|nr:hypothetical protein [Methylocystis echinoides]GLI93255.1 membrane protein [Methylocystis echinoides]
MTDLTFTFAPLLPWPLLAVLALLAVVVLILGAALGQRATILRALGLALALAALTDPSLVREKRDPQKTVVAVVIDRSESQNFGARPAQTEEARKALETALAKFGDVETRFATVTNDASGNDGTKLFGALEQALKDVPPERVGGALLVTDGVVHDIPAKAEALGFHAPVHALITGREGERDRRIELVEAPRFGIVGKEQTVRARVVDTGGDGARAPITVRRDGEQLPTYSPVPGDIVNIPVKITHGGANIVELEVPPAPGEITLADNKAVLTIEGVRDRLKVLLVSGEPHPGERAWRNLLRADANVELVHFTILRPPEKLDVTPASELALIAFPTADLFGRKINEFDLIIFDRYSNQTLLPSVYFDNIARFVEKGGAFLAAVGPDYASTQGLYYSPLENLLPARPDGSLYEQPFRARVSKDGEKHPVTRGLPGARAEPPQWGQWFRQVDADVLKGNSILSGAQDKPLLVLSHEGKGRVALLLSDQIWLWARGYDGGGPNADLTRRLAHWLMKEPDLEEEALRAQAKGREVTIERQTLKDEAAPVTATAPSGAQSQVTLRQSAPGLWRAPLDANEMGLWRFESDGLTALVNVGPANPREFREVASTVEKLAPLAEATGGTVRRLSRASDAVTLPRLVEMTDANRYGGADWIGVRQTGASTLVGVEVAPLGLGLWAMLALLSLVVTAWAWEGRR